MNASWQPGLIPLVIGVTGHRDIPAEDVPTLEKSVEAFLLEIKQSHPSSPLLLVSALAEGADRLAARVALSLGIGLGVILPMDRLEYEKDFTTRESKAEFAELLEAASFAVAAQTSSAGDRPTDEGQRVLAYRAAGIEISGHGQMLLALWDGNHNGKIGGTADIVSLFRSGLPGMHEHVVHPFDEPKRGPVIHVLTRRMSDPAGIDVHQVGAREELPPVPSGAIGEGRAPLVDDPENRRWKQVFQRIEEFNRDATAFARTASGASGMAQSREYLVGGKILGSDASPSAETALNLYQVADAMSNSARNDRLRRFRWIISVAIVAVFCEQLYSGPFLVVLWILGALVAGSLAYLIFRVAMRDRVEERFQDYRALAEACRVQFFWEMAGLRECAADHYLRDQRDELEWLRQAIRTLKLPAKAVGMVSPPSSPSLHFVLENWIRDQRKYFVGTHDKPGGAAAKNQMLSARWDMLARRLFLAGLLDMLVLLVFHAAFMESFGELGDPIVQGLIVMYGVLFASAGVCKVYREVMSFEEQSRRYSKMGLYYVSCEGQYVLALEAGHMQQVHSIILEMGRQALAENGDWLLLHRQRPIAVPI